MPKTYTPLCEIPSNKHPLNVDRYMRLQEELKDIAGALAEVGYAGHPYAAELVDLANNASVAVRLLWEEMRSIEKQEKAELAENASTGKSDGS